MTTGFPRLVLDAEDPGVEVEDFTIERESATITKDGTIYTMAFHNVPISGRIRGLIDRGFALNMPQVTVRYGRLCFVGYIVQIEYYGRDYVNEIIFRSFEEPKWEVPSEAHLRADCPGFRDV